MFWKPARARRLAALLLVALVGAVLWAGFSGSPGGLIARGDFPAFYTAANAVWQGDASRLYDQDFQAELQNRLLPEMQGRYLSFAYPPFFAALLSPLSIFGPNSAKLLFTALQLGAAALSFVMLLVAAPHLKRTALVLAVLGASFGPLFTALLGGQNTALSMLLLISSAYLLSRRTPIKEALAGVAVALWLFKPQLCVLFVLALALRPGRKVGLWFFGAAASVIVGISGMLVGWDSWRSWLMNAAWFARTDAAVNGRLMVSLPAVLSEPFRSSALYSSSLILGTAAALGLGSYALVRYRRAAVSSNAQDELSELLLLGAAAVLCAPHALYYDVALFLPAAAVLWSPRSDREVWQLLVFQTVVFAFCAWKEIFFVQPLGILAPFSLAFLYRRARQGGVDFV